MNTSLLVGVALLAPFASTLAQTGDEALMNEARTVATTLPPKLIVALQDEIKKSGAEHAIPVCKDMAPKMAGEISQQTGWKIKRVSLKPRNDARAIPDPWEKAALEDFDKRAAAGEEPAKLEKGDYDWAHLALNYWPERVRERCKSDKSLAIAHGLEQVYIKPEARPKKARGRKNAGGDE